MKKLLNLIFFISITFIFTSKLFAIEEKIKIGLLLPLDGQNHNIGKSVLRAVNLAVPDEYDFNDADLVEVLRQKVPQFLD